MTKTCCICGVTYTEGGMYKCDSYLVGKAKSELDIYHLTPREVHIVKLLTIPSTNQEIADRLHLEVGTVKVYMSKILGKTKFKNRTQLALWATKEGMRADL